MNIDTLLFTGMTLDTAGTVLIAYTVLRVHSRVRKEHRIDEYVAREMRREKAYGIAGIVLIITGYVLGLIGYSI